MRDHWYHVFSFTKKFRISILNSSQIFPKNSADLLQNFIKVYKNKYKKTSLRCVHESPEILPKVVQNFISFSKTFWIFFSIFHKNCLNWFHWGPVCHDEVPKTDLDAISFGAPSSSVFRRKYLKLYSAQSDESQS